LRLLLRPLTKGSYFRKGRTPRALSCRLTCALALTCCTLTSLALAGSAQGVLVYDRVHAGHREIVVAKDDGSARHVIAKGIFPVVSPDGRNVAFFAGRRGKRGLWVVRIDGRHARRYVSHTDARNIAATLYDPFRWSPNSRYILGNISTPCAGTLRKVGCGAATLIRVGRGVVARYRKVDIVDGVTFSPDSRKFVLARVTGDGSSQGGGGLLELGGTRRPGNLRLLGSGERPNWGRPGLAFLSADTKSGVDEVDLVTSPGAPPRTLFTQMPGGNRLDDIVNWTVGTGDLLIGLLDAAADIEPALIDPRTAAVQEFPQRLMALSAISRDGRTVLGESLQGEVVRVRADGNVKVLASHADSATWTS